MIENQINKIDELSNMFSNSDYSQRVLSPEEELFNKKFLELEKKIIIHFVKNKIQIKADIGRLSTIINHIKNKINRRKYDNKTKLIKLEKLLKNIC